MDADLLAIAVRHDPTLLAELLKHLGQEQENESPRAE